MTKSKMTVANVTKLCDEILLIHMPPEPNLEWIAKIQNRYPGLEVRWVPLKLSFDEKGVHMNAIDAETWSGVTLACLFMPHPADFMKDVRYVQLTSAGVDKWTQNEIYKKPETLICTAKGVHAPQIAEWVLGTWLMMSHGLLKYVDFQKQSTWCKQASPVRDSPGLRVGILGYGAVGRQCARLTSAIGMEVYAFTRTPRTTSEERKDDTCHIHGMGDPDGLIPAKWFHGTTKNAINNFLSQDLDLLILCLPLTQLTETIIGREQFDTLGRGRKRTFVSNVSRGKVVDTDALLDALRSGTISGAALDVTDPEPLPDGHPLFQAPNVVITPHISWQSANNWDRILSILENNLERLSTGGKMINIVDKKSNY